MATSMQSNKTEFVIINKADKHRADAEQIIERRYLETYKAQLYHYSEIFVATKYHNSISAILGLTFGENSPFFLERYFKVPMEELLMQKLNTPINRNNILELGCFASTDASASRELIFATSAWLSQVARTYKYSLFTLTSPVARLLRRFKLDFQHLQTASNKPLSEYEKTLWGQYYDFNPSVFFTDIPAGTKQLSKLSPKEWEHYSALVYPTSTAFMREVK